MMRARKTGIEQLPLQYGVFAPPLADLIEVLLFDEASWITGMSIPQMRLGLESTH